MASSVRGFRIVFGVLLLGAVVSQNDPDIKECEQYGLDAGKIAFVGACAKLKLSCPSFLVYVGRSDDAARIPAELVTKVLRTSCEITFQSACKQSAVETVFSSNDTICQDILRNPIELEEAVECRTHEAALGVFKKALNAVCNSTPDFITNPVDRLVSEGHPAFQSTTISGREASKAVDGKLATGADCTSTGFSDEEKATRDPWWSVDLEATWNVTRVLITNRKDCCGEELSDFEIRVGESPPFGSGEGGPPPNDVVCQTNASVPQGETKEFECLGSGRFVTIRIPGADKVLSLCEVQVYAKADDRPYQDKYVDLSTGKDTFQISTLKGAISGRAVDGVKDTDFGAGSCTRTGFDSRNLLDMNPWWAVDLGAPQAVAAVRITTRSDCCYGRLKDFEIRIGNDKPSGRGDQNEVCATGSTIPRGETYQYDCKGTGRYVSIRITGYRTVLVLCEVEVLGSSTS